MRSDPLTSLHDAITKERHAILEGDYAALEQINAVKQTHIHALEDAPPSQDQLRALRQAMQANQALMQAAMRGVQTAKERLTALQKVKLGLTTYQQDGTLDNRQTADARVEKKA